MQVQLFELFSIVQADRLFKLLGPRWDGSLASMLTGFRNNYEMPVRNTCSGGYEKAQMGIFVVFVGNSILLKA